MRNNAKRSTSCKHEGKNLANCARKLLGIEPVSKPAGGMRPSNCYGGTPSEGVDDCGSYGGVARSVGCLVKVSHITRTTCYNNIALSVRAVCAGGAVCVARGHLEEVGPGGITLVVKQKLQESLWKGVRQGEAPPLWRIDRDDIASNYVRARSNLIGAHPYESPELFPKVVPPRRSRCVGRSRVPFDTEIFVICKPCDNLCSKSACRPPGKLSDATDAFMPPSVCL